MWLVVVVVVIVWCVYTHTYDMTAIDGQKEREWEKNINQSFNIHTQCLFLVHYY